MASEKSEPADSFSYDLLDNWQSHAEAPEPESELQFKFGEKVGTESHSPR